MMTETRAPLATRAARCETPMHICLKVADGFAIDRLSVGLMKSLKFIGLTLAVSLALSGAAFADDITVALAGPMTGSEAGTGQQIKNAAEIAVADINAGGGLLGKKLVLHIEDDACD